MKHKVWDVILMIVIIIWGIASVFCGKDHYADYPRDVQQQIMVEQMAH